MKTLLITILITFITSFSFVQKPYSIDSYGNISDFYVKTQFYNICEVDYDFKKAHNCIEVPQSIIIDVDDNGTGKIHLFLKQKTTFYISMCYKSGNSFQFNIKNSKGTELKASLFVTNQNKITKFYLKDIHNNTGFMLYY